MNNDLFAFMMMLSAASVTANIALGIAFWRLARRLKRAERQVAPESDDERTVRLERAMESLTSQMDQLMSGQEFLNRVMADRLDRMSRGLPEPDSASTPH